jgi:hypothetical protein
MQIAPAKHPQRAPLRKQFGPYSKVGSLALLDQRSGPALFIKNHRHQLAEACGGKPDPIQAALIERCCWLALRLTQLEKKMATGELTEKDNSYFIAWSNAYARTLAKVGIKTASDDNPPKPSDNSELDEVIDDITRQKA